MTEEPKLSVKGPKIHFLGQNKKNEESGHNLFSILHENRLRK